jgi:hypothetical protein
MQQRFGTGFSIYQPKLDKISQKLDKISKKQNQISPKLDKISKKNRSNQLVIKSARN